MEFPARRLATITVVLPFGAAGIMWAADHYHWKWFAPFAVVLTAASTICFLLGIGLWIHIAWSWARSRGVRQMPLAVIGLGLILVIAGTAWAVTSKQSDPPSAEVSSGLAKSRLDENKKNASAPAQAPTATPQRAAAVFSNHIPPTDVPQTRLPKEVMVERRMTVAPFVVEWLHANPNVPRDSPKLIPLMMSYVNKRLEETGHSWKVTPDTVGVMVGNLVVDMKIDGGPVGVSVVGGSHNSFYDTDIKNVDTGVALVNTNNNSFEHTKIEAKKSKPAEAPKEKE